MKFRSLQNSTVLIDFNNQVWRNFHATEKQNLTNSDGINVGCIIGLVKVLNYSIKKCKDEGSAPNLVICEDRYPIRKHKLYENNQHVFKDYPTPVKYKGTRPKKKYAYNPIDICRQYVDCIPHIKIYMEEEEADDVIASFISKNSNIPIHLYTTDRDLWQLLPKYKKLSIILDDGTEPNKTRLEKSFEKDVTFDKILLYKIIKGDSGDNVKSVNRFQFKKTKESFIRCDGTIEDYVRCIGEDFGTDSKEFNQLMDNFELIRLNLRLVKLKENLKYTVESYPQPDINKWMKLCQVFETPSLMKTGLLKIF